MQIFRVVEAYLKSPPRPKATNVSSKTALKCDRVRVESQKNSHFPGIHLNTGKITLASLEGNIVLKLGNYMEIIRNS